MYQICKLHQTTLILQDHPYLSQFTLDHSRLAADLRNINLGKAAGPDNISPREIKLVD